MTVEIISWSIFSKVWDQAGIKLMTLGSAVHLFLLFPTFLICFTLHYFFLKMPYYPYFYILEWYLRVKIQKFFLPHSVCLGLINHLMFFFQGARCKTSGFLFLIPKVSLFSLYYCHSFYPAYLLWNFLFLTTHCDKFFTWKSPTIPTFLHQ